MGLRLIQETLLTYDGMRPSTALSEHVLQHFGRSLDAIVSWSKTAKPCDYGQFSPKIFELAAQNDALAQNLLKGTAKDIERLIFRLKEIGATQIALMGGIGERIQNWLSLEAQEGLVKPQSDAINGALLMARGEHNLYSNSR